MSVTAWETGKSAHGEGAPWNAGWFWLPVPNERYPAPGPGYYGDTALLAVDTAGLFFSCQRFAQICGSSGYLVISVVSRSSHHEKKGREASRDPAQTVLPLDWCPSTAARGGREKEPIGY